MFAKLALRNVKRQIRSYLIYFVTVALSVALLFAVNNLSCSDLIRALAEESSDVGSMFTMVTVLSSLVTALVLSYAAGFMLKLRKKEFGMYLTLGMTRQNIQTLFALETLILYGLALAVGIGAGLLIFQLVAALFSAIMEIPFEISAYSARGALMTLAVSGGLFVLSALASLRYLRKVTVSELLKEESAEKGEKHPVVWGILSFITLSGLIFSLVMTCRSFINTFIMQESLHLLMWLVIDLAAIFISHFTLSRTLAGILLCCPGLKNRGTNAVVLRGLSGKMTINSLLIGALATLMTFAVVMANVAFTEKIFSDRSLEKDCPYDIIATFRTDEEQGVSMEEGRRIIEKYSAISAEIDYQLYSLGESTLSDNIVGSDEMGWIDRYMPLSQFNRLLEGCGYEPVELGDEYLLVTTVKGICDTDFSDVRVTLNGRTCSFAGSSTHYPYLVREWLYFVVPDEVIGDMPVADICAAYTLENSRPEAGALMDELVYEREIGDGVITLSSNYRVREYIRQASNANVGVLIIGTLYVSTLFVCMALAILSVKTLSTLDEEKKRFDVLYRLGADERTRRSALFREIGVFFLMPFALPFLLTVPMGLLWGKAYEFWNFSGLGSQNAMATSLFIMLTVAAVYALYFAITYRIACDKVIS